VVGLAYLQRIGLRYLDAIAPTEGHFVEDYLTFGLLGNGASLRGTFRQSFAETQVESERGCLISKVLIVDGGLPIPMNCIRFSSNFRRDFVAFREGRPPLIMIASRRNE